MRWFDARKISFAAVMSLGLAGGAGAGQIVSASVADASGGSVNHGGPIIISPLNSPDNNVNGSTVLSDPADSDNQLNLLAIWTATAPITVAYDVANSAGGTEYSLDTTFRNRTGVDWTGLIIELGRLDSNAVFQAGAFHGLDFDTSPDDAAFVFPWYSLDGPVTFTYFAFPNFIKPQTHLDDTIAIHAPDHLGDIIRTDELFEGGATYNHSVHIAIDVPNDPGLAAWAKGSQDYQFALRFTPVPVPEPGSAALTASMVTSLLLRRGRR